MDYTTYENFIVELCEKGHFEEAEEEKKKIIPVLKGLLKINDETGIKILELFSQLAGEAESLGNFSDLLEELVAESLITESYGEQLINDSSANRWF